MDNHNNRLFGGLFSEEESDRVDEFCFATAGVLRRILGLCPTKEAGPVEAGNQQEKGLDNV